MVGPWIIHGLAGGDPDSVDQLLLECIGFALLFAATTYAGRLYLNLRRKRDAGRSVGPDPPIRPLITLAVGALGGLLVEGGDESLRRTPSAVAEGGSQVP